jgi:hypothetical protein
MFNHGSQESRCTKALCGDDINKCCGLFAFVTILFGSTALYGYYSGDNPSNDLKMFGIIFESFGGFSLACVAVNTLSSFFCSSNQQYNVALLQGQQREQEDPPIRGLPV